MKRPLHLAVACSWSKSCAQVFTDTRLLSGSICENRRPVAAGVNERREARKILVQLFRRHVLQHPLRANPARLSCRHACQAFFADELECRALGFNDVVGDLPAPRGENALIDVEPDIAVRFEVIDEQRAQAQSPAAVIDDCFVSPNAISEQSFEGATGARDAARP
jgi:hypothetical protein